MPTDEQRMRAQVAKWRREDYAVDRYGLISEAMWDGYRSRDAEVQALRDEAQNLRVSLRDGAAWAKWTTERDERRERMVTAIAPVVYGEALRDGQRDGWEPGWREAAAAEALLFADTLLAMLARSVPTLEAKDE